MRNRSTEKVQKEQNEERDSNLYQKKRDLDKKIKDQQILVGKGKIIVNNSSSKSVYPCFRFERSCRTTADGPNLHS